MPDYDHLCQNPKCQFLWEETYSIHADPPKVCPQCSFEGVKRLIAENIGVSVKLSTREFKESLAEEKKKIKKQLKTDEKLKANLAGENSYHNMLTEQKRIEKNYGTEIKKIDKKLSGE